MGINKMNEIRHRSEEYREFKKLFKNFKDRLNEKMSKYKKDYEISLLETSSDTNVIMSVFDDKVEISFLMVFDNKELAGSLIFERFKTKDEREHICTFYFDKEGNVYRESEKPFALLTDEKTIEKILVEFLSDYLELQRFKPQKL